MTWREKVVDLTVTIVAEELKSMGTTGAISKLDEGVLL